jgi:putative oxidoreductase
MSVSRKSDLGILVLRLGVGLTAFYYGAQHLLGVFGGAGLHATVESMKSEFGIPPVMAILAVVAEFFGGFGILVGFFTSIAAFGFACTMAGATFVTWKSEGLAVQLFTLGTPKIAAEAFYTPSLFCAAFAIMLLGGGTFSLDERVFGKKAKKKSK